MGLRLSLAGLGAGWPEVASRLSRDRGTRTQKRRLGRGRCALFAVIPGPKAEGPRYFTMSDTQVRETAGSFSPARPPPFPAAPASRALAAPPVATRRRRPRCPADGTPRA